MLRAYSWCLYIDFWRFQLARENHLAYKIVLFTTVAILSFHLCFVLSSKSSSACIFGSSMLKSCRSLLLFILFLAWASNASSVLPFGNLTSILIFFWDNHFLCWEFILRRSIWEVNWVNNWFGWNVFLSANLLQQSWIALIVLTTFKFKSNYWSWENWGAEI